MRLMEWGFEELRPDAPFSGGAENFAIRRKIHNFVRESVQNSTDQLLAAGSPVKVTFRFEELEGEDLTVFLREIGWTNGLEEHLQACASQENYDQLRLSRNLDKLRSRGTMRILRVSDSNTNGLNGPELGRKGNFCKLCRNEMIPSEGAGNAGRGGAFGVGKSVYWAFSGFGTVVFSSVFLDENGNEANRVFGRTYLPDHELNGATFSGDAFFCVRDPRDQRVSMSYSQAAIGPNSLLHRDGGDLGTSVIVLMYEELESEDEQPLDDVARRFRDAVVANFWPMIHEGLLDATVEWSSRGGSGSETVLVPAEFDPLVRALCHDQKEDILVLNSEPEPLEIGATAFFSSQIVIPARKKEGDERPAAPDARVSVCVTRITEEEKLGLVAFEERYKDMKFINRLASLRGAKMVVENREYVGTGCFDHVGVVRTGRYRTSDAVVSQDDEGVEQFLRDSEPPAHDSWQFVDKIRENYEKPYAKVAEDMFRGVASGLGRILRKVLKGDKDRPDGLAELLKGQPVGAPPPPPPPKSFHFKSEMECSFDLGKKVVTCTATVRRIGPARLVRTPWTATLGLEANGEQGNSSLHHISAVVTEGLPVDFNGPAMNVESCTVAVPANQDSFEITMKVSLSSVTDAVLARLRLNLKMDARIV